MNENASRSKVLRSGGALLALLLFNLALVPAAFAAECLEYEFFFRRGGVFPNPYNNLTQNPVTGHLTVLVFDKDLNMHLARVKRDANYNVLGQTVVSKKNFGTFETEGSLLLPNLWDGKNNNNVPVASGTYWLRLFADSSLCGREEHSVKSTVLH